MRRWSLRTRLLLIIMTVVTLVIAAGSVLTVYQDRERLRDQTVSETRHLLLALQPDVTRFLLLGSPDLASDLVRKIEAFPMIMQFDLFDSSAEHVLRYRTNAEEAPTHEAASPASIKTGEYQFSGRWLAMRQPLEVAGTTLGEARITISNDRLEARIEDMVELLTLFVPTTLVLAALVALFLQEMFTRPLVRLTEALRKVAIDKDYGVRLETRDLSEVGELYQGFNTMLDSIQENSAKLSRQTEQLSYQAAHDALTGLMNRKAFEEELQHAYDGAVDWDEQNVLMYADLDQFKIVNDTCGHVAGDELLRQLAGVLRTRVRAGDHLARLGGDEFGIVLSHCDLDQARSIAAELIELVSNFRFDWEGRAFSIGISIGIATIDPNSSSVMELLANADTACYAAKDSGRNRYYLHQHDDQLLARRHGDMAQVSVIRDAIDEDRLVLFRQPIVHAYKNSGMRYEILVRMRGQDGELIPPGRFLPPAERYGLIDQIDRWVLGKVLAGLQGNPQHLESLTECAINLSGASVTRSDFLDFALDSLRKVPGVGGKLCFEITETTAIGNLDSVVKLMDGLRSEGVTFALDDFGSGMSSFAYLKHLPVDKVKIDGQFVRDMLEDPIDFAMVQSINEIVHVMRKQTVAEFVEDQQTAEALAAIGVDFLQGYHIGRPAPHVLKVERDLATS